VVREIDAAIARIEDRLAKDKGPLEQEKANHKETEDEKSVAQPSEIGGDTDSRD
jgi:hypothetical protein